MHLPKSGITLLFVANSAILCLGLIIALPGFSTSSRSQGVVLAEAVKRVDFIRPPRIEPLQPKEQTLEFEIISRQVASAKKAAATPAVGVTKSTQKEARQFGVYESSSPSDAASLTRLDEIKAGGFGLILNYSIMGGTPTQVKAYLDHAQKLGLKIIFNLKDFYDLEPNGWGDPVKFSSYGSTSEQVALGIVKEFKSHPALWGWYLSDERPERVEDLSKWQSVLRDRYLKVKSLDPSHPTLIVLACYSGDLGWLANGLKSLSSSSDTLGLDSYPIPYHPVQLVGACSSLLSQTITDKWFVLQSFSWVSYPESLNGALDPSLARYPTKDELKSMVEQAISNGVKNILFYSYFDLKKDTANFPTQWQNLTAVVKSFKKLM